MSRFKVSVIALGVLVVAVVSIGACAGQAPATARTHTGVVRLVSGAVRAAPVRVAQLPGTAADSEWALASHVNW